MDSNHGQKNKLDLESSKGGNSKGKNTRTIILVAALCLLIMLALTLKATTYIEKPEFCKQCHSMKFYYNTWVESTHSKVSCFSCHVGFTPVKEVKPLPMTNKRYWALSFGEKTYNVSDFMNRVKEGVISFNRQVVQANRQVNFITARMQDVMKFLSVTSIGAGQTDISNMWGNCVSCHKDRGPTSKNDGTGHSEHQKLGLTCQQCHRTVVHGTSVIMKREECLVCHKKPLGWPPSHNTSNFRTEHGKNYITRKNCTLCHVKGSQEKICMDCHGIVMPHPKDFPSKHIQSINSNIEACMKCHQVKGNKGTKKRDSTVTCSKCHGPGLPHKRSGRTIATHGALAVKKGVPSCLNCHKSENCISCHGLEMPHPKGFLSQHTQSIKNLGIDTCVKCHSKAAGTDKKCNDCHGMEMPHPGNWKDTHGADPKCSKCHSPKNPANPKATWARDGFCNTCHSIKRHAENHWELAAVEVDCYKCHTQAGCDRCH